MAEILPANSQVTRRPRLLDLFCGAGGASMGYHLAGFDVIGIDLEPQPRYPFEFHQLDAVEYLQQRVGLEVFDAIHASPPCQAFTRMTNCRPGAADEHPDLVDVVREQLDQIGLPWVIENVTGSPLRSPVTLCGQMFGLPLYRHRQFECSEFVWQPEHPQHVLPTSPAGRWEPGTIITVAGHFAPVSVAREAMGISWMDRNALAQAIPPAYTRYIGEQLLTNSTITTREGTLA